MDGFTSVTDAVKTTASLGIGLPTLQSGHIELTITRIYPCPHRTAGKVDWNAGYPTLHVPNLHPAHMLQIDYELQSADGIPFKGRIDHTIHEVE